MKRTMTEAQKAALEKARAASAAKRKNQPTAEKRDIRVDVEKKELPAWVKSAEAGPPVPAEDRPSLAEMAAATARKPRVSRAQKASPPAPPGSLRAVGAAWLGHMASSGKTPATCSSYGNDLELAYEYFGDVAAADASKRLPEFNASKLCMQKKSGKPKAKPTILKTQRAIRMALAWAAKGVAS